MFSNEQWLANPSSGFYNGVATQSLRFDQDSSTYLTRTPSSAGDKKTWTWSGWIKRASLISGSPYSGFGIIFAGGNEQNMWAIPANCTMIAYWINTEQLVVLGSGNTVLRQTSARQRDLSAWYHFVVAMDTTQGTANDRTKVYINGVQQTSFDTTNNVSQNTDLNINETSNHLIGGQQTSNIASYMNMYLAETNFVDGTALDASYFGETKNGVWIPKRYTGSYGTNGFRLQFAQVGVGTASTSTIGADTSGNTHHFTSSGIVASDCAMPDSPENNFATWNVLSKGAGTSTAEGNLKAIYSSNNQAGISSTFSVDTGKYYFEVGCQTASVLIGVAPSTYKNPDNINSTTGSIHYASGGNKSLAGTETSYGASYGDGDVIGVALNLDDGEVTFYKNNSSQGALSLTSGLSYGISSASGSSSSTFTVILNSGQDSSFAGTETAQGNTDGNSIGDFYYAPPSGFLALCTANLPEPTIGANSDTQADDYFNTVLYTGTGNTNAISGVGFQPDWLWLKKRGESDNHGLFDSTRGTNGRLQSDTEDVESTGGNQLDSFDSDGFTLDDNAEDQFNKNNVTFVAWNWKANGGTTTTNDASSTGIGTIDSVFQANTTAGFSIVTYTGNSTAGATVRHGLTVAPEMIIVKNRTNATYWCVYHKDVGVDRYIELDRTGASQAQGDYNMFNSTAPTSSVFSLGTLASTNTSHNYIAYCFHPVEGYSKFGGYVGNNAADGIFVYLGFRPAFIMIKRSNATEHWHILDNKRDSFNGVDNELWASLPNDESSGTERGDFLSNGFKIRGNNAGYNTSHNYIYMAFAEAPFKYANAR